MWGISHDSAKFAVIALLKILGTHFDPFEGHWTLWYPHLTADRNLYSLERVQIGSMEHQQR